MACDADRLDVSAILGVSMRMQFLRQVDTWILTPWCGRVGEEKMARELMAITGLSAQELVHLARTAFASAGGTASAIARAERAAVTGITWRGVRPVTTAADLAEAVMGNEAWNTYNNAAYKSMHGPRKPQGSAACDKRTKERRSKLGRSLAGWTLQNEPEHFAGTDTHWTMGQTLTWLPPDGDVNHMHLETLGNMISEAFHQHKAKMRDATKTVTKSSTAAEASDWNGVTSRLLQTQEVTRCGRDSILSVRLEPMPRVKR